MKKNPFVLWLMGVFVVGSIVFGFQYLDRQTIQARDEKMAKIEREWIEFQHFMEEQNPGCRYEGSVRATRVVIMDCNGELVLRKPRNG